MNDFKSLNLSTALQTAIDELGYTTPTPIQAETLPLLLEGPTDFLGLAATGTGKTAAFGIPLLESLNNSRQEVQAVVLCPTRELALQVTEQLNSLGRHKKLRAVPVYGGAGYGDQIRGLRQGAQIVVATPGRLIDHIERGTVDLAKVRTVVLDEADEMISMGFKDALETILESMPPEEYKTWLFSATMSKDVRRVADRFLKEPKSVQINKTEMLSGTVKQIYYKVKEGDKLDILCKIIDTAEDFYGLVFCQTKSLVMDLTGALSGRGYQVDCLHGDKDQNQRERTMRAFRERRVRIVVCTDVAARGIDIKDLTHVVNYSIPRELDNYVHRIGRTGRSGKAGLALSLVTPSHQGLVGRIEAMTKSKMELGVIPTRKEVGARKLTKIFERFQGADAFARAEELLTDEWLAALEPMSKSEIASRLLVLTFPEVFVDHEKSKAAQLPGNPRQQRPLDGGMVREERGPRREQRYGEGRAPRREQRYGEGRAPRREQRYGEERGAKREPRRDFSSSEENGPWQRSGPMDRKKYRFSARDERPRFEGRDKKREEGRTFGGARRERFGSDERRIGFGDRDRDRRRPSGGEAGKGSGVEPEARDGFDGRKQRRPYGERKGARRPRW